MSPENASLHVELEQRLRFETLIADLSSKFVNLPAGDVDREIEDAQRRVCELLSLDLCVLWQWTHDTPRYITITHLYRPLGGPPPPKRMDAQEMAPWCFPQVSAGRIVAVESMDSLPPEAARDKQVWLHYGIRSTLVFPLSAGGQLLGAVTFNTVREERPWQKEIVNRLTVVAQVFANALARKVADEALRQSLAENERLRERLQAESDYLKAEIKVTAAHGEIIGRSRAIRQVLSLVEQVAPTDSSVLIHGETGTGKELIAQAIHRLSPRQGHIMIKVNCAALPSALVESELFGREKGAFTGALTRQIGRFEVADSSTIFLDEIGELSPEVQAKLLRVLQEGQFERLGSPQTIKVNVRVIAATNRDLTEDLRAGRFRKDLYYRLNVFPIRVPPRRERAEDIPLLVWAFLKEISSRMGKKITQVPRQTMEALQSHPWPGNVRELRNVIEYGAIVTSGDTLRVPMLPAVEPAAHPVETLASSEKEHILKVLEESGWRIKGPRGAATMQGLNPSTLYSRMQKLGIPNRRQKKIAGNSGAVVVRSKPDSRKDLTQFGHPFMDDRRASPRSDNCPTIPDQCPIILGLGGQIDRNAHPKAPSNDTFRSQDQYPAGLWPLGKQALDDGTSRLVAKGRFRGVRPGLSRRIRCLFSAAGIFPPPFSAAARVGKQADRNLEVPSPLLAAAGLSRAKPYSQSRRMARTPARSAPRLVAPTCRLLSLLERRTSHPAAGGAVTRPAFTHPGQAGRRR